MCRSQIPSLPKNRGQYQQRQFQQTRNVKNITEKEEETIAPPLEEEEDEETIDPEPTMYITELMEDWNKINLIERDILAKLGLTLTQQQKEGKKILNINENIVEQNITKWIFKKYPHLCTRLGRSKNHIAKPIMKQEKTPTQHKGRRVPLHLVEKVENELQKLIEDKQIIRLEKCPDDLFISPVVITVKKDKSIKIALDSKELNKAIHKINTKCKASII